MFRTNKEVDGIYDEKTLRMVKEHIEGLMEQNQSNFENANERGKLIFQGRHSAYHMILNEVSYRLGDRQHCKPSCVTSIWDSGGETVDRYSVFFADGTPANKGMQTGFAVCGHGGRTFSQFSEGVPGGHLGKLIQWRDLPGDTRKHIWHRLEE